MPSVYTRFSMGAFEGQLALLDRGPAYCYNSCISVQMKAGEPLLPLFVAGG